LRLGSEVEELMQREACGKAGTMALAGVLALAGCSPDYDPIGTQHASYEVAVAPTAVSLQEGETATLDVAVRDASGNGTKPDDVAWRSQNPRIAAVSRNGEVLGLSEGEVFIYASRGHRRDSARVVVTRGSDADEGSADDASSAAGEYPNEPGDHELIAHAPMSEMFKWGPRDLPSGTGSWWQWREGDPDSSLHEEPGIPGGPHFNRTRYRSGLAPGSAPVNWGGWNAGSAQSGDEYERIYFSKHIRLVDNGRGDWESQRVGTKVGFFGVGRCSGSNAEIYLLLQGGTRSDFTIRMMQQGPVSRGIGQNRDSSPLIRVGKWQHWEIEMVLNDVGRSNGIIRWWIDGRLIMEHHDVEYRTRKDPCGFIAYKWNPTWGGTGGGPKSRDDFIDISEIRISGKRLR
jgi:hypothetical protein